MLNKEPSRAGDAQPRGFTMDAFKIRAPSDGTLALREVIKSFFAVFVNALLNSKVSPSQLAKVFCHRVKRQDDPDDKLAAIKQLF